MNVDNPKILVVDDAIENLNLLVKILAEQGYAVYAANCGQVAIEQATTVCPDLILLDIDLPDVNGFEVCEHLKAQPATRDIPILFISVLDQIFDKVRAFEVGGADYILKPFHIEEVLARVETQLAIRKLVQTLARQNAELSFEIATRKEYEQALEQIATTDPLTRIKNRRSFFELAEKEMNRARRYNQPLAILLFDIDHFKKVNDTYGHLVGDQVLVSLAKTCQVNLRNFDILARYGGEEFVVLMPETDQQAAVVAAERLRVLVAQSQIQSQFLKTTPYVSITISLGVMSWQGKSELALKTLIQRADEALYQSKQQGRNRVTVWSETGSVE